MEKPLHCFIRRMIGQRRFQIGYKRQCIILPNHLIIHRKCPGIGQGISNHRAQAGFDIGTRNATEIACRRVIRAAQNAFGILKRHLTDSIDQDITGLTHGIFRRTVHAQFDFIGITTKSGLIHQLLGGFYTVRQGDMRHRIGIKAILHTKLGSHGLNTGIKCLL